VNFTLMILLDQAPAERGISVAIRNSKFGEEI
jgi:hypothetical protein